jgi:hypothetical protein
MSTNFYWEHPGQDDPCPQCGQPRPKQLLHIGRSSCGWKFLWRGYSPEDSEHDFIIPKPRYWWPLLELGGRILDEYHREMSFVNFKAMIEDGAKRGRSNKSTRWFTIINFTSGDMADREFS